jgi:hypothetical protein
MNLKDKISNFVFNKSTPNQSYLGYFSSKMKRKAMTPFYYLGGIILTYYFLKYLYHRQLYKLSSGGFEDKLDKLISVTEENNKLQRENKTLLEKLNKSR